MFARHLQLRPHFASQIRSKANGTILAIGRVMPKSHEELICWQLSDQLRQLIITHTKDGDAAKDFRFTSNLRDAVSSTCRNQSEGFYKFRH
jgi:hypothetical protein